jgi:hypothetical protein
MQFKIFDNPYHAAIDRVSRTLSPTTIYRILSEPYYLGWQKLPADVFVAACIIVCLHRICRSPLALFAFGNHDQLQDPLYQNAINAIKQVYQEILKTRDCKNCGYLGETSATGTKKYFCSHPETDFLEIEFNLVPNPAQNCDFFDRRDYDRR